MRRGLFVIPLLVLGAAPGRAADDAVVLTCESTSQETVGSVTLPKTIHFRGVGATVDEAEARFDTGRSGPAFAACSDFQGRWRRPDGTIGRVFGNSAEQVAQRLREAGAPVGAVRQWRDRNAR